MIIRRRKPEWRYEPGRGYHLRQYEGGRPTGLVAVVNHISATHAPWLDGVDVRLIRERSRLVIVELRARGDAPGPQLRIPLRSCVNAELHTEAGLPGSILLRLTLTYRVGRDATATVRLWFPSGGRAFLHRIVSDISGPAEPAPAPAEPTLSRLPVDRAPDDANWLVFRSVDDDVVIGKGGEDDRSDLGLRFVPHEQPRP
jgi:hypothetical protein